MNLPRTSVKNKAILAERVTRCAAFEAIKATGDKDAIRVAGAELSAWIVENCPPQRASYSSRAGKRQRAEMNANRR